VGGGETGDTAADDDDMSIPESAEPRS
jgi:hypothetical protein